MLKHLGTYLLYAVAVTVLVVSGIGMVLDFISVTQWPSLSSAFGFLYNVIGHILGWLLFYRARAKQTSGETKIRLDP